MPDISKKPEVPQAPEAPETALEQELPPEAPREVQPPAVEAEPPTPPPAPPALEEPAVVPSAPKDEVAKRIETILEEDIMGLYMAMPPEIQRIFKERGEQTATKIRTLLAAATVKVKEILNLIKDWLRLIPGVNPFFLEQEAKIKTDKIMNLREKK